MGLSSSKQKTTSTPYDPAAIKAGSSALTSAYNTNQPAIQSIASQVQGLVPSLIDKYQQGNPAVTSAENYVSDVLGGKYLDAGNPYLQGMIDSTNSDVANQVNALFSRAGQTGSSRQIGELGKQLSNAENTLRYNDYNTERSNMNTAAGLAPGLAAGEAVSITPALAAAEAGASIPLGAASQYAGGLGSLLSPYGTQTTTQSQGLGSILGGVLGAGLAGWASGGGALFPTASTVVRVHVPAGTGEGEYPVAVSASGRRRGQPAELHATFTVRVRCSDR